MGAQEPAEDGISRRFPVAGRHVCVSSGAQASRMKPPSARNRPRRPFASLACGEASARCLTVEASDHLFCAGTASWCARHPDDDHGIAWKLVRQPRKRIIGFCADHDRAYELGMMTRRICPCAASVRCAASPGRSTRRTRTAAARVDGREGVPLARTGRSDHRRSGPRERLGRSSRA